MGLRRKLQVTASIFLVSSCSAEPEVTCEIDDPQGPYVEIVAKELEQTDQWVVQELWRAGGLRDGSQLTFPTSGRVGQNGTFAVADFQVGEVWRFGPDGQWIGSIGARGQGPGELLNPLAVAWTDENEMLVLDAGNQRLERYDVDGVALETLSLPDDLLGPVSASGQVGWYGLTGDGTAFIELPSTVGDDGAGRVVFARGGPGDEERQITWESVYPESQVPGYNRPSLPEWPRSLLATGRSGWVLAPKSSRYELVVHDLTNQLRLHICVSDAEFFGQPPIGDEEAIDPAVPGVDELHAPPDSALFSRIVVDGSGRIWVERDLPRVGMGFDELYGVPGARLDVISWEGEFLGRVKLPEGVRFQDAQGDSIWGFSIGEFNEVEVFAGALASPD